MFFFCYEKIVCVFKNKTFLLFKVIKKGKSTNLYKIIFNSKYSLFNVNIVQSQDDERDKDLTLEDLLPKEPVQPISYETLLILLGKSFSLTYLFYNSFTLQ